MLRNVSIEMSHKTFNYVACVWLIRVNSKKRTKSVCTTIKLYTKPIRCRFKKTADIVPVDEYNTHYFARVVSA